LACDRDRPLENPGEIAIERPPVEPGRVRVLHEPARRRDCAGGPEADRPARPELGLGLEHHGSDGVQRLRVAALRALTPAPQEHRPGFGERDDLDLGAPEVDPQRERHRINVIGRR
jgi:hypothetical protein